MEPDYSAGGTVLLPPLVNQDDLASITWGSLALTISVGVSGPEVQGRVTTRRPPNGHTSCPLVFVVSSTQVSVKYLYMIK